MGEYYQGWHSSSSDQESSGLYLLSWNYCYACSVLLSKVSVFMINYKVTGGIVSVPEPQYSHLGLVSVLTAVSGQSQGEDQVSRQTTTFPPAPPLSLKQRS